MIVATRDLPVGSLIDTSDLAVTSARLGDRAYAAEISVDQMAALFGRQVVRPNPRQPSNWCRRRAWGRARSPSILAILS